jgi:hypothetical protein
MKKSPGESHALVATRLSSTESEQEQTRSLHEHEHDHENKSSRENFIFTDEYNLLYHFYVEGRSIKEVATVPPDV